MMDDGALHTARMRAQLASLAREAPAVSDLGRLADCALRNPAWLSADEIRILADAMAHQAGAWFGPATASNFPLPDLT